MSWNRGVFLTLGLCKHWPIGKTLVESLELRTREAVLRALFIECVINLKRISKILIEDLGSLRETMETTRADARRRDKC